MTVQHLGSRDLLVVGAGAVARQVASLVADLADSPYRIVGYLDTRTTARPHDCGPLLGGDEALAGVDAAYVIAIGNPAVRRRVDALATSCNRRPAVLVHPASTLDHGVELAPGTILLPGARIQAHAQLGHHVLVNANAVVGHDCVIENHAVLGPLAMLGGGVVVERCVLVGAGATVLPERVIGAGATVGAGAVVTKNVPPFGRVAGVPAKRIR